MSIDEAENEGAAGRARRPEQGRVEDDSAGGGGLSRLPVRSVLGYGLGDVFGGGSTTTINMFYLFFLTSVAGISPALAGTAILVSKIWDAVTDPVMGLITDNTRTRLGRRRPYFLLGIPLIVASFSAMWISPAEASETLRFVYALFAYLLFSTVYTMVWVPYNAIAAEMTPDYDERTRLSTARIIFSNLGGIVCAMTARDFFVAVFRPSDPRAGFAIMGITFGLFFALPYVFTVLWCRENPQYMKEAPRRIENIGRYVRENFLAPFKLRAFRHVALMYLFGFMVLDSVVAMAVFFMQYFLRIDNTFSLLVPVYGGMLAVMPFVRLLSERIGKRETYLVAGGVLALALGLVPFITPEGRDLVMTVFGILFGVSMSAIQVMVFAMFPDVPDADELYSGRRREGVYSGVFAFLRKAGSAVTVFLVGAVLELIGFVPPLQEIVEGVAVQIPQPQPESFASGIRLAFLGFPAVFGAAALIAAYGYPLSRNRLLRLKSVLTARRSGKQGGGERAPAEDVARVESELREELR